ncbi:MAG TPA: hypothetical protein VFM02_00755 [Candidatus Paceibacterota bacterium]|nr:hypothetical protein [Candidatus Paceibacterota bacterium]
MFSKAQLWDYQDEEIRIFRFKNLEQGRMARHILVTDPELENIPFSPEVRGFAAPEDFVAKIRRKMDARGLWFSLQPYISGRSLSPEQKRERSF